MSSWELTLSPLSTFRNAANGRFMKGHTPANKGKKWGEYLSRRAQRGSARGWKNLELYRHHSENGGRPKKAVIAIDDVGKWKFYESVSLAGRILGVRWDNIARCCRLNHAGAKGANNDHRYMRYRFYYESDNIWMTKIK